MLKAFGEARELDEAPHGWSGVSCQTAASTTSSVLSAAERIRQQHSCTPRRFGVAAAYLTVRRASRIDTSTTKSTTFRKKKILYWVFFVGFVVFEVFVARSLFEFLAVVRRGVGAQPLPSVVRSFSGVDRVLVAVFGPLAVVRRGVGRSTLSPVVVRASLVSIAIFFAVFGFRGCTAPLSRVLRFIFVARLPGSLCLKFFSAVQTPCVMLGFFLVVQDAGRAVSDFLRSHGPAFLILRDFPVAAHFLRLQPLSKACTTGPCSEAAALHQAEIAIASSP